MKLVILTPCIIRGEFHKKSLGKFYNVCGNYLKEFEIYHIFNIDSPEYLKQYFTSYETIGIIKELVPEFVNKTFILNETAGFLNAYKNLMNKVKELNLLSEDNLFWWFEDDWEVIQNYNIFNLVKLFCQVKNLSMNFVDRSPLGSFIAGPIMSGEYFINYFNIEHLKVMNNGCDPEKQVGRWLSGNDRKNGKKRIHRDITNNEIINIFVLYHDKKCININDFNYWYYNKPEKYNKNLIFKYYVLVNNNNNFEISNITNNMLNLDFENIDINEFKQRFDNKNIKYISVHPYAFRDIGRYFNSDFNLEKWDAKTDTTSYKIVKYATVYYGNNDNLNIDILRLKPESTQNDDFFKSFYEIVINLPYLEQKYPDIKFNINYYSHRYGTYPNFYVFGNVIKLNYIPTQMNNLNMNIINDNLRDKNSTYHLNYILKYFKFNIKVNSIEYKGKTGICMQNYKLISDTQFIFSKDYPIRQNYYDEIIELINKNELKLELELKLKQLSIKNQEHLEDIMTNLIIMSYCDSIMCDNQYILNLVKMLNPNINIISVK